MDVAFFSTKRYDREFFDRANEQHGHRLEYFEPRLTNETAPLASGYPGVCAFVNDMVSAEVIERLAGEGLRVVALRCAGFNNVDLAAAKRHDVLVARVPAYSPYAVAEHTIGLLLALDRKLHRAYWRIRDGNFALDGLLGFDIHGRTVGIVGTGKIGTVVARIFHGMGCKLLAFDPFPNEECQRLGVGYVSIEDLLGESDIVSLHCPLSPQTHHMIDDAAIRRMRPGVVLLNTSRGALIDTVAVIRGLKSGRVGALGIDVYEEESDLFFEDLSDQVIQDDVFARLLTFPNVLVTGHQAFFTREAMAKIAETTLANLTEIERTGSCDNLVRLEQHVRRGSST